MTNDTNEEWTALHSAARIALGAVLEGEATARMERRVRLAWESMLNDDAGVDEADMYANDSAPVSTFRLWSEFGGSSGLRSRLSFRLEECGEVIESSSDLDDVMRAAYVDCVRNGLHRMPWAVQEVADMG